MSNIKSQATEYWSSKPNQTQLRSKVPVNNNPNSLSNQPSSQPEPRWEWRKSAAQGLEGRQGRQGRQVNEEDSEREQKGLRKRHYRYSLKLPAKMRGDGEQTNPNVSFRNLFTGFTEQTTSHGFVHVFYAPGTVKKLAWAIMFLIITGILILHVRFLVTKFTQFDVAVNTELMRPRRLRFPAVTICNNNPVRSNANISSLSSRASALNGTGYRSKERIYARKDLLSELSHESDEDRHKKGHQLEDFILYCSYNSQPCDMDKDFWQFQNPLFGNCFTYNSGKLNTRNNNTNRFNTDTIRNIFQAGPQHGLELTLNIQQYLYSDLLTETAGATVVIHNQTDMPFPEISGVSLHPGMRTGLSLNVLDVEKLPNPFSPCLPDHRAGLILYEVPFEVDYTQEACLQTCYQRWVERSCSCYDPEVQPTDRGKNRPCFQGNPTERECLGLTQELFSKDKLDCNDCYAPCKQQYYKPTISTAQWPADSYVNELMQSLRKTDNGTMAEIQQAARQETPQVPIKTAIRKNLLQISAFFEEIVIQKSIESEAYSVPQFISDLGGCFGLWVGWSILTFFEIVEFLSDCCALAYMKCGRSKSKSRQRKEREETTPRVKPALGGFIEMNVKDVKT